ncbi:MAG TPA: CRISPR-associated endonuclease Cas2 [Candidatus Cloacimonadota bacterium]|nr:CRISPR-associated endonuclease Cas2 [Candidatus Cloacimonadota bacterium]
MMILVTYDVDTASVGGQKRLRRVAKLCENHGQRVQYSTFECVLEPSMFADLKYKLEAVIDKKKDSLRFYNLGSNWNRKVEHIGAKPSINFEEDTLVI